MTCNDDYCGLASQLDDVSLTAGNTYYFIVDGYGGDCGSYVINVSSDETVCEVECPADANDEQEACGGDSNGGCNMEIPSTGLVEPYALGNKCEEVSITTSCLPAGRHWLFVAFKDFYDSPCDSNYVATLSCEECVLPSPDIHIEPNQLIFDCNVVDGVTYSSTATEPDVVSSAQVGLNVNNESVGQGNRWLSEKLIDAEFISQNFEEGFDRISVIVKLAEAEAISAVTNWTSKDSLNAMRYEIADRQESVLSALTFNEFEVGYRYENVAAFSGAVTQEGLTKLLNDADVESIEPVRVLEAHVAQGIGLMNAPIYRSSYNGAGTAIAICDTGVDYNHAMLGGGGFPNSKVIGGYDYGGTIDNPFSPDPDPDPIPVGQAHGTCCAGIAAGDVTTVGDYIGGVAYNAKIYALKIAADNSGSAYTSDMVAAWDWCISHRDDDPNNPIKAISTSFGGSRYFDTSSCDSLSPAMTAAANNAVAAGITVLASSGNDGYCDSMGWPACISSVISVGAVYDDSFGTFYPCVNAASCATKYAGSCPTSYYAIDETTADMVTSYSNTATFLDLLAPSNQAYTTDIEGSQGYSSGDYFDSFGGTSAACPYTAGAVACLQQAAYELTGNYLSPEEVRTKLAATGDSIADGKIPTITKPRVNLGNAIDSIKPCLGEVFRIYNEGSALLEVESVNVPSWVTLSPTPPYSIAAGQELAVCVEVDCNECDGFMLSERLLVYSNDTDENPFPGGVYIDVNCPLCNTPGDFEPDCDVDTNDLEFFIYYWLGTDCNNLAGDESDWCFGTDLNKLGSVDFFDFAVLAENWLECKLEPPDGCWQ
jgi:subtilisin family serine protease